MLFHVLYLCSVCYIEIHDPFQVENKGCWWILWWWIHSVQGALGGISYSTAGWVWSSQHTGSYCPCLSLVWKLLVGIMENLEHQYGKIWTSLIRGNQILWIFTTFAPLIGWVQLHAGINPMDLQPAAPGDHFPPLSHHPCPSLGCGNEVWDEGQTGILWDLSCPWVSCRDRTEIPAQPHSFSGHHYSITNIKAWKIASFHLV